MSFLGIFGQPRLASAAINAPLPVEALAPGSPWSDSENLKQATFAHLSESFTSENAPMTRAQAMSLSAVAKARGIIAGTIGRFPLVQMTGAERSANPYAWVEQIEPARPRSQTIAWTIDHLIFYGRAYWLVNERYSTGYPKSFTWVPEHYADVDEYGYLTAAFGQEVDPREYIRFDAHHEGLLSYGKRILRKALATERAAENAAANPVPSIELHQTDGDDLTDEEIDTLLDRWRHARTSAGGGVGYTSPTVDVRTHGQAAEQLLIDAQNQAALGIARALGLPAWAVDASIDGQSMNYSNSASRGRELIDFGLAPYMAAITDRLSMSDVAPRGVWLKFETADYLDPPMREKLEALKVGIEAGIYTAAEARKIMQGIPLESKANEYDGNQDESNGGFDRGGENSSKEDHRQNSGIR